MQHIKLDVHSCARELLLALMALLLMACAGLQQGADEMEMDTNIGLAAAPEGMASDHLIVTLLDADGQPVTDAVVSLEGNMNHAGMVPVITDAVTDEADGSADGLYHVPFQFTMMGDWIITVSVQWSDGSTTTHNIDVTANDAGVLISDAGALTTSGDLSVLNAMARPVPVAGGNGAIYLTIANRGDREDRLESASSSLAPVELHETTDDNGVMRMRMQPDGFIIPPGDRLILEPGGKHIMLVGIENALEPGQTVPLTLAFANTPPITLTVPVHNFDAMEMEMDGDMDVEHASHQYAKFRYWCASRFGKLRANTGSTQQTSLPKQSHVYGRPAFAV